MSAPQGYKTIDKFDRLLGQLIGLPDVTQCKPTLVRVTSPIIGDTRTITVQLVRQKDQGETLFVEHIDENGCVRIVLPAAAVEAKMEAPEQ